jgi:hypothetical protein
LRDEKGNAAGFAKVPPIQEHQKFLVAMLTKIFRNAFRREFFAKQRRFGFGAQRHKIRAAPGRLPQESPASFTFTGATVEMKPRDSLGRHLPIPPLLEDRLFFAGDEVPTQSKASTAALQRFHQFPGSTRTAPRADQFAWKINDVGGFDEQRELVFASRIDRRVPGQSRLPGKESAARTGDERQTKDSGRANGDKRESSQPGLRLSSRLPHPFSITNSFCDAHSRFRGR